jgi:hypothetical protein
VFEHLRGSARGLEGGPLGPPSGGAGGWSPPRGGSGAAPPKKKFRIGTTYFWDHMIFRWFFGTWFFADGFLFPVKELGFWTNLGHWVRVLDAAGSYMYIVL